MNSKVRKNKLDSLSSDDVDFSIVSNARCLSEGIDVPTLDAVAFIDPRRSITDIIQAIGRAIRKSPGKDKGYIFIPLVLSEEEILNGEIEKTSYAQILKVIESLKAHDERLVDELIEIRIKHLKYSKSSKIPRVNIDIPQKLSKKFFDKVNISLITDLNENWFKNYEILLEYLKESGPDNLNSRTQYFSKSYDKNFYVGNWLYKQRGFYKKGLLTDEKIKLIEELEFWSWDPYEESFNRKLNLLEEYISEFGKVPSSGKLYKGFDLGDFVQTSKYRNNIGKLSDERRKKFDNIAGFYWSYQDKEEIVCERYKKICFGI